MALNSLICAVVPLRNSSLVDKKDSLQTELNYVTCKMSSLVLYFLHAVKIGTIVNRISDVQLFCRGSLQVNVIFDVLF